jgi:hypothetical protein
MQFLLAHAPYIHTCPTKHSHANPTIDFRWPRYVAYGRAAGGGGRGCRPVTRHTPMVVIALGLCLCFAAAASALDTAPPVQMPTRAEMTAALARSDMVWSWNASVPASVPMLWTEAPFVGNGMVGAYIMVGKGSSSEMHIEVARADYWDVRLPGTKYYANRSYLDTPRLPGGYLTLTAPAGATISSGVARVHLANASLTMELVVTPGAAAAANGSGAATTLTLSAVALADRPSMLLFEGSCFNGFLNLSFTNRAANGNRGQDPTPNPPAECAPPSGEGVVVCKQDLIAVSAATAHANGLPKKALGQ